MSNKSMGMHNPWSILGMRKVCRQVSCCQREGTQVADCEVMASVDATANHNQKLMLGGEIKLYKALMSKKQSGPTIVAVCDDAVSGSESDKDVADELRVSMEGVHNHTQNTKPLLLYPSNMYLQLSTSELLKLRASMILNFLQSSNESKIAGEKT
jgi:hypothetical protein